MQIRKLSEIKIQFNVSFFNQNFFFINYMMCEKTTNMDRETFFFRIVKNDKKKKNCTQKRKKIKKTRDRKLLCFVVVKYISVV